MKRSFFLKTISLLTCLFYLGGQFEAYALEIKFPETAPFLIPAEWGSVQDLHGQAPKVVLIQDAHGEYEAQKNTAAILQFLSQKQPIQNLLLEGGAGKLDPKRLEFFKERHLNQKAVDFLAKEAEAGGVEIFMLSDAAFQKQPSVFGLEDPALYAQNVEAFQKVMRLRPQAEAFLETELSGIRQEAGRILNGDFKAFFKEWINYESSQDLVRFLNPLQTQAAKNLNTDFNDPRSQLEWPQLVRFFELKKRESQLQPDWAKKEKETLLQWVQTVGIGRPFVEFLERPDAPLAGRRQFWEKFFEAAGPKGFRFEDFPHLMLSEGAQILQQEMEARDLFEEIRSVTEQILQKMAGTRQERDLLERARRFFLVKKLLSLQLTRHEFEETKTVFSSTGASDIFHAARLFYSLAVKREETMARLLTASKGRTIAVTGGFHTEFLAAVLKKEGISYAVVSPHLSQISQNIKYTAALTGQETKMDFQNSMLMQATWMWPEAERRLVSLSARRKSFRSQIEKWGSLHGAARSEARVTFTLDDAGYQARLNRHNSAQTIQDQRTKFFQAMTDLHLKLALKIGHEETVTAKKKMGPKDRTDFERRLAAMKTTLGFLKKTTDAFTRKNYRKAFSNWEIFRAGVLSLGLEEMGISLFELSSKTAVLLRFAMGAPLLEDARKKAVDSAYEDTVNAFIHLMLFLKTTSKDNEEEKEQREKSLADLLAISDRLIDVYDERLENRPELNEIYLPPDESRPLDVLFKSKTGKNSFSDELLERYGLYEDDLLFNFFTRVSGFLKKTEEGWQKRSEARTERYRGHFSFAQNRFFIHFDLISDGKGSIQIKNGERVLETYEVALKDERVIRFGKAPGNNIQFKKEQIEEGIYESLSREALSLKYEFGAWFFQNEKGSRPVEYRGRFYALSAEWQPVLSVQSLINHFAGLEEELEELVLDYEKKGILDENENVKSTASLKRLSAAFRRLQDFVQKIYLAETGYLPLEYSGKTNEFLRRSQRLYQSFKTAIKSRQSERSEMRSKEPRRRHRWMSYEERKADFEKQLAEVVAGAKINPGETHPKEFLHAIALGMGQAYVRNFLTKAKYFKIDFAAYGIHLPAAPLPPDKTTPSRRWLSDQAPRLLQDAEARERWAATVLFLADFGLMGTLPAYALVKAARIGKGTRELDKAVAGDLGIKLSGIGHTLIGVKAARPPRRSPSMMDFLAKAASTKLELEESSPRSPRNESEITDPMTRLKNQFWSGFQIEYLVTHSQFASKGGAFFEKVVTRDTAKNFSKTERAVIARLIASKSSDYSRIGWAFRNRKSASEIKEIIFGRPAPEGPAGLYEKIRQKIEGDPALKTEFEKMTAEAGIEKPFPPEFFYWLRSRKYLSRQAARWIGKLVIYDGMHVRPLQKNTSLQAVREMVENYFYGKRAEEIAQENGPIPLNVFKNWMRGRRSADRYSGIDRLREALDPDHPIQGLMEPASAYRRVAKPLLLPEMAERKEDGTGLTESMPDWKVYETLSAYTGPKPLAVLFLRMGQRFGKNKRIAEVFTEALQKVWGKENPQLEAADITASLAGVLTKAVEQKDEMLAADFFKTFLESAYTLRYRFQKDKAAGFLVKIIRSIQQMPPASSDVLGLQKSIEASDEIEDWLAVRLITVLRTRPQNESWQEIYRAAAEHLYKPVRLIPDEQAQAYEEGRVKKPSGLRYLRWSERYDLKKMRGLQKDHETRLLQQSRIVKEFLGSEASPGYGPNLQGFVLKRYPFMVKTKSQPRGLPLEELVQQAQEALLKLAYNYNPQPVLTWPLEKIEDNAERGVFLAKLDSWSVRLASDIEKLNAQIEEKKEEQRKKEANVLRKKYRRFVEEKKLVDLTGRLHREYQAGLPSGGGELIKEILELRQTIERKIIRTLFRIYARGRLLQFFQKHLAAVKKAGGIEVSMEERLGGDDDKETFREIFEDPSVVPFHEQIGTELLGQNQILNQVIEALPNQRMKAVLRIHYGLDPAYQGTAVTHADLAEILAFRGLGGRRKVISDQAIRQLISEGKRLVTQNYIRVSQENLRREWDRFVAGLGMEDRDPPEPLAIYAEPGMNRIPAGSYIFLPGLEAYGGQTLTVEISDHEENRAQGPGVLYQLPNGKTQRLYPYHLLLRLRQNQKQIAVYTVQIQPRGTSAQQLSVSKISGEAPPPKSEMRTKEESASFRIESVLQSYSKDFALWAEDPEGTGRPNAAITRYDFRVGEVQPQKVKPPKDPSNEKAFRRYQQAQLRIKKFEKAVQRIRGRAEEISLSASQMKEKAFQTNDLKLWEQARDLQQKSEEMKKRAEAFGRSTTVIVVHAPTYLLANENRYGVYHVGRRGVVYFTARYIDSLHLNRARDMDKLAFFLDRAQRRIEPLERGLREVEAKTLAAENVMKYVPESFEAGDRLFLRSGDFNAVLQHLDALAQKDAAEKPAREKEIERLQQGISHIEEAFNRFMVSPGKRPSFASLKEVAQLLDRLLHAYSAEGMKDGDSSFDFFAASEILETMQGHLNENKKLPTRHELDLLARLYGILAHLQENVGQHDNAIRSYKAQVDVWKEGQRGPEWAPYPLQIQEQIVRTLLKLGLYDDFRRELNVFLTGNDFPRKLYRFERKMLGDWLEMAAFETELIAILENKEELIRLVREGFAQAREKIKNGKWGEETTEHFSDEPAKYMVLENKEKILVTIDVTAAPMTGKGAFQMAGYSSRSLMPRRVYHVLGERIRSYFAAGIFSKDKTNKLQFEISHGKVRFYESDIFWFESAVLPDGKLDSHAKIHGDPMKSAAGYSPKEKAADRKLLQALLYFIQQKQLVSEEQLKKFIPLRKNQNGRSEMRAGEFSLKNSALYRERLERHNPADIIEEEFKLLKQKLVDFQIFMDGEYELAQESFRERKLSERNPQLEEAVLGAFQRAIEGSRKALDFLEERKFFDASLAWKGGAIEYLKKFYEDDELPDVVEIFQLLRRFALGAPLEEKARQDAVSKAYEAFEKALLNHLAALGDEAHQQAYLDKLLNFSRFLIDLYQIRLEYPLLRHELYLGRDGRAFDQPFGFKENLFYEKILDAYGLYEDDLLFDFYSRIIHFLEKASKTNSRSEMRKDPMTVLGSDRRGGYTVPIGTFGRSPMDRGKSWHISFPKILVQKKLDDSGMLTILGDNHFANFGEKYAGKKIDTFLAWSDTVGQYVVMLVRLEGVSDLIPMKTVWAPDASGNYKKLLSSFYIQSPTDRGRSWSGSFPKILVKTKLDPSGILQMFGENLAFLGVGYANKSVEVYFQWSENAGKYVVMSVRPEGARKKLPFITAWAPDEAGGYSSLIGSFYDSKNDRGKSWQKEFPKILLKTRLDKSSSLAVLGQNRVAKLDRKFRNKPVDVFLEWSDAAKKYVAIAIKPEGARRAIPMKTVWMPDDSGEYTVLMDSYYRYITSPHLGFWRKLSPRIMIKSRLTSKGALNILRGKLETPVATFGKKHGDKRVNVYLEWSEIKGIYLSSQVDFLNQEGYAFSIFLGRIEKAAYGVPENFPGAEVKHTFYARHAFLYYLRQFSPVSEGDRVWIPWSRAKQSNLFLEVFRGRRFDFSGLAPQGAVYGVYRWTKAAPELAGVWLNHQWIDAGQLTKYQKRIEKKDEALISSLQEKAAELWPRNEDAQQAALLAAMEGIIEGVEEEVLLQKMQKAAAKVMNPHFHQTVDWIDEFEDAGRKARSEVREETSILEVSVKVTNKILALDLEEIKTFYALLFPDIAPKALINKEDRAKAASAYGRLLASDAAIVLPAQMVLGLSKKAREEYFSLIYKGLGSDGKFLTRIIFAGKGAVELKEKFSGGRTAVWHDLFKFTPMDEFTAAKDQKREGISISFTEMQEHAADSRIPALLLPAEKIEKLSEPDRFRYLNQLTQLQLFAAQAPELRGLKGEPLEIALIRFLRKLQIDFDSQNGFITPSTQSLLAADLSQALAAAKLTSQAA